METLLEFSVPLWGFMLGTLVLSRVLGWIQAMASAQQEKRRIPLAAILHSGPWLIAGVGVWAYHILSAPHARAWAWFFGAAAAAVPTMIAIAIFISRRRKRLRASGELASDDRRSAPP